MALQRLVCDSCDAKIPARAFCPRCGSPTKVATNQQRILWEMGQLGEARTQVVPEKPARLTVEPERIRTRQPAAAARAEVYDGRMVQGSSAMAIEQLDLRQAPPARVARSGGPQGATTTPPERREHPPLPAVARNGSARPVARADEPADTGRDAATVAPERAPDAAQDAAPRDARSDEELRRAIVTRPASPRRSGPPIRSGRIPVPPRRPDRSSEAARTAPEAVPAPPAAPQPPAEAFKPPAVTDGRTLVIKRRQAGAQAEPAPDPFETATILREISERSAKVPSRRERRRERKREQERAAKARAEAEKARKEAEKARKAAEKKAKKRSKREASEAAAANPSQDTAELPDPGSIEIPEAPPRPSWKDRKALKLLDAIGGVEGEELVEMHDGRSRLRAATLLVTNFRVAVVGRGARRKVIGWIPLEEIERVKLVWRGAETLHVEGSFERLSFQAAASGILGELDAALRAMVKDARKPGSARHSADVIQAWCERTAEVWENGANRMRLWIRKHPAATLVGLSSLVPAAYMLSSNL